MHPKRIAKRPMFWGLILVAGLTAAVTQGRQPGPAQPVPVTPPTAGEVTVDKTGALLVPLGGLVSFDPKLPPGTLLSEVVVAQEAFLQVRLDPNNPGKLLMTGRAPGLTQLTLIVKDKPKIVFDVIVQPDLALLRSLIRRTVPTGAVDVQAGIGNVIVLSGYVTSPQDADIITRLAISATGNVDNVINAVQVGGGQQVQIDVVVASVNRNLLRERGFDFAINGSNSGFASIVSGLIGGQIVPTGAVGTILMPIVSGGANLQLGVLNGRGDSFLGALRALRTEGVAKFIAEPRVVTQTGRPAFFRAGGQQAVISGASGITGPGVVLVPFGTELEVLPIVYGNGTIWLEINPRISAVSAGLGLTIGGTTTPGFTEQQVRTAVMLESGQTFAIGGLIQTSVQATASKVPVLGELPFIGTAFSRVSHQTIENELVILVTPRLVGPMNCDQVPKRLPGMESRNPDDYELFLENILEAPRGQRKVWNGRCYNAPYKCDPTAAIFPCVGSVCNGTPGCGANGPLVNGAGNVNIGPRPPVALPPVGLPGLPGGIPAIPGGIPAIPAVLPPANAPTAPAIPMAPPALPSAVNRTERTGVEPAPINLPGLPPVVSLPELPRN